MKLNSPQNYPSLSIVIPAMNAEKTIGRCIVSVLQQEYPKEFDITVAIGPSKDRTMEILRELASKESRIQIIDNPTGRTPTALNLAIAASTGEVIARVDAQSKLPPNYLQEAVSTLMKVGAANVGGMQLPIANNDTQRIIALAMRSPFGAGPADFRGHGEEGPTDTVYLGTFNRKILESVGGFNESLIRNQDYELNWRLRQAGHLIWFTPKLKVEYEPRSTLKQLASQYSQYGSWKRRMLIENPRSTKFRHLVAPLLVLGLLGSIATVCLGQLFGLVVPVCYLTALIVISLFISDEQHLTPADRIRLILAFMTMHISWGNGFLILPTNKSSKSQ